MEQTKGHAEELDCPQSPDADYGLRNGFDPTRYDFYNPISHNARKAFAGRLEEYVDARGPLPLERGTEG